MTPVPLYDTYGRLVATVDVPARVDLMVIGWKGRYFASHANGRYLECRGYTVPTRAEPEGRLRRRDED